MQISNQDFKPLSLAAGRRTFDVRAGIVCAELTQPNRCNVTGAEISPVFIPGSIQTGGSRVAVEPCLLIQVRPVIVRGVAQLIDDAQCDWIVGNTNQISSLPTTNAAIAVVALDKDEQLWIDGQNRVSCGFGSYRPARPKWSCSA